MDTYSFRDLGYNNLLIRDDVQVAGVPDLAESILSIGSGSTNGTTDLVNDSVSPSDFSSGEFVEHLINAKDGHIRSADCLAYDSGTGYFLGWNPTSKEYVFFIGDSAGDKLTWDGSALAVSGAFSAGTIDIGGSDATSFHVDIDGNMWLGAATFALAPFSVSNAGALVATSATITGAITANTGYIGGVNGWVISANYIKDVAGVTGLSSVVTAGDDIRIWAGHATPASAPFYVTEAGALTASSATITGVITANTGYIGGATGWVIATGKMTSTGIGLATSAGDATYAIWAGDDTPASAEFSVSHAGALVATSATITGAITATSGSIGSFTIGTYLYTGTKTAYDDANAGVHIGSDGIGIGNNIFTVSSAGALVATSATITGSITATSGDIGGWVVTSGYIYNLVSGTPTSLPSDGIVLASGNEGIIVYENTEKRIELGYLASGIYGLKGYADDGTTVVFELSDTQKLIGGFSFTDTQLSATASGNTTIVSSGATAFSAGPTGSPTVTITQAGVATFSNVILTDTVSINGATTGATGTELETLTGGATSDASSLHKHPKNIQVFTSNGTWTKPTGYDVVEVVCVGAGGGGGGGSLTTGTGAESGGGGGGGGAVTRVIFQASTLGATETVTVGVGGTGGAARSTSGNGNDGTNGGLSSFGTWITAGGGGLGGGGNTDGNKAYGGGGGGGLGSASAEVGGTPTIAADGISGQGSTAPTTASARCAEYGGGTGGTSTDTGSSSAGGSSIFGGGGGGAGGRNYGGVTGNGASGGTVQSYTNGGGGAGGVGGEGDTPAGDGTSGSSNAVLLKGYCGSGGGGGGGRDNGTGNCGSGGNGGDPGGGGGGGGSWRNHTSGNSGAGGAGGDGIVIVYCF